MNQTFIIRYAEIGLKGGNRPLFEKSLISNIKARLGPGVNFSRQRGQILLTCPSRDVMAVSRLLTQTFGIAWFSQVQTINPELDSLKTSLTAYAKSYLNLATSFALRIVRRDKHYPHTSLELERLLGHHVQTLTHLPVNLTHPDHTIHLIIDHPSAYLYTEKTPGPGGLPVGTSGRVLSLLSGGFDSIASSYLLAKRGAAVDFLHFHIFTDHQQVMATKIKAILDSLCQFTTSHHLYLGSYLPFQMKVINLPAKYQKYELIVFRRLMHLVGESLAAQHGYQALVTGDSLGQVASQTMDNLTAVDAALDLPIFRPLIGFDKTETIALVRALGLEDQATAPYKDCCSLVATHPATRANLKTIQALEDHINIGSLVAQIAADIAVVNLAL